jgi:hypothetical protein
MGMKLFVLSIPFICTVVACYLFLQLDRVGAILFGVFGLITAMLSLWVLFLTSSQVNKGACKVIILCLFAICVLVIAGAAI